MFTGERQPGRARHLPIDLTRNRKGEWNTDSGKLLMAQASISAFRGDGGFLFAQSEVSRIDKNRWVRFRKIYPKLRQFGRIEGGATPIPPEKFRRLQGLKSRKIAPKRNRKDGKIKNAKNEQKVQTGVVSLPDRERPPQLQQTVQAMRTFLQAELPGTCL